MTEIVRHLIASILIIGRESRSETLAARTLANVAFVIAKLTCRVHSRIDWAAIGAIGFSFVLVAHPAAAQVALPDIDPAFTIHVGADTFAKVQRGEYDVIAFEGGCELKQGALTARADEIILWIERNRLLGSEYPGKVICYLNGSAELDFGNGQRLEDHRWTGRLFSMHDVAIDRGKEVTRYDIPQLDWKKEPFPLRLAQFNRSDDSVFVAPPLLGNTGSTTKVRPASSQVVTPTPGGVPWLPSDRSGGTNNSELLPSGGINISPDGAAIPQANTSPESLTRPPESLELAPAFPSAQEQVVQQVPVAAPFAAKNVQFFPRSSTPPNIQQSYDEQRGEQIAQIRGGFKLVVEGIQIQNSDGSSSEFGTVTLEADNAVVWIRSDGPLNPFEGFTSTSDRPIELYLEGNIVFFQGNRVIYAERMYYNVSSEYGMILSAEVLTPVPQYQGLLRLKADVLHQLDSRNFRAYGAAVTSSRMGMPRYWVQSNEVNFQDYRPEDDLSVFAPVSENRPTQMKVRSRGNYFYLAGFPIFWWPTLTTDLSEPSFYLTSIKFKNDQIFGFQTLAEWNLYELLGIDAPEGTRLRLSTDYLSERGPAIGTRFDYDRPSTWLFGAPGSGWSDTWFVRDDGLDQLGIGRFDLPPEEDLRGRAVGRHRFFLSPTWELMAETGWISDRNFLEQYFEQEWETEKDYVTALRARRYNGNRMFEIYGQTRINDFFTETEWLPRIDHYILGQDLLGQRLTWSVHNHVGYGHQKTATTPVNAAEAAQTTPMDWETDSEGVRVGTRQELSLPFALGALKIVPYVSGEAAYWKEDVNQNDVTRLTGQAGVRSSLPMWSVNPNVENRLFDLRGLAHKMTLETEVFYADSNRDLDRFPLYDPLDDNAQEHFRRRFITNGFGGALPPEFDERLFALRSGMQRWVTAGSTEIMDDMSQVRVGINNRWQTKRGVPGRERIVDLISLDADFTFFPKADRDNFGEDFGAFTYDFRYHVGDRLTLLSDGYVDVFSQGLKAVSAGARVSRPGRGDAYIGMQSIEGPISANVLNGYVNYRMNEKWILNSGAAYDFGSTGSIGQSLSFTRIGESALVRVGAQIDHGRDNFQLFFNIEPRFLPTMGLGLVGGELVPPAGLYGLE